MSVSDIVDLCSDDEDVQADIKPIIHREERDIKPIIHENASSSTVQPANFNSGNVFPGKFDKYIKREPKEDGVSNNCRMAQTSSRTSDQESTVVDASSPTSVSPLCSAPICRQFWKAGNYDDEQASKIVLPSGKNHLRVHPKFLHSNATSHKWALGAIAELLDNAVDEIQNGATFVIVDKISNPRDGSHALLFQDDGGGMDPEGIRRCMSFGFSVKKSNTSIGQYGNGFKTSTMRLGADVIVFTRRMCNRVLTQSAGLLSYSFLKSTGHDDIVVPMVDYKFDSSTGAFRPFFTGGGDHFTSNLSVLLKWSPYATEDELFKQFDDIGHHGTKVVVFNLWLNDDGLTELDFESDQEDIMIRGAPKILETKNVAKMLTQKHIANRYHYSLRVYSSILYMRMPENFKMILRGKVVEHHNIGRDLKYPEFILYKPQVGGNMEVQVITTIGFAKEAPHVNVHGFNVYHKNRLIMPFWRVINQTNSRGKCVVGILEANFIEPTHDKQDFERTPLFQKLEARLKQMTLEYWDFHCQLIGIKPLKRSAQQVLANGGIQPVVINANTPANDVSTPRSSSVGGGLFSDRAGTSSPISAGRPVVTALGAPNAPNPMLRPASSVHLTHGQPPGFESELPAKRKRQNHIEVPGPMDRQVTDIAPGTVSGVGTKVDKVKGGNNGQTSLRNAEIGALMQEKQKLQLQCAVYKKTEEELQNKIKHLEIELHSVNGTYAKLLKEYQSMETVKVEKL